jgi:hypothetical protein
VTALLLLLGAVLLASGGLALLLLRRSAEADGPYPPEAAEAPDPVDAVQDEYQRGSWFVDGGHPKDCTEKCCFEIRLNDLHDAFDWHAAEHEMRSKR